MNSKPKYFWASHYCSVFLGFSLLVNFFIDTTLINFFTIVNQSLWMSSFNSSKNSENMVHILPSLIFLVFKWTLLIGLYFCSWCLSIHLIQHDLMKPGQYAFLHGSTQTQCSYYIITMPYLRHRRNILELTQYSLFLWKHLIIIIIIYISKK